MIPRLKSGRFWLKLAAFGGMLLPVTAGGLYMALQTLFSHANLHAAAQEALAGTGRTLRFDSSVGRTLFPRPTVTLRNVTLKSAGSIQDVHLGEMRIGLAWASVFGRPEVEKWVVKQPQITLEQDEQGRWNLQDLWLKGGGSLRLNRLIVENAHIIINSPAGQYVLSGFNLKSARESSGSRRFEISSRTGNAYLKNLRWESSGTLNNTGQGWALPDWRFKAEAEYRNEPLAVTAAGSMKWQLQNLALDKITFNLNSPLYQTHISAVIPAAQWRGGRFYAENVNSFINARHDEADWSGALNLSKLTVEPRRTAVGQAVLNAGRKSSSDTTSFSISSPAYWQAGRGWQLPDLKIATRQNPSQTAVGVRFISSLGGSFQTTGDGSWQTELKGLFDKQDASLKAAYDHTTRHLNTQAGLSKLVFAPYMQAFSGKSKIRYPEWLTGPQALTVDAALTLGTLQLPQLEVNRIRTRLRADRNRIDLTGFSAELYGGTSTGSLHIENRDPLNYRLIQQAKNVQILPLMQDLLRYNNLSGTGDAALDFSTKGQNRRELTGNLNGRLNLKVQRGALLGVDINNILKQQTPSQDRDAYTPFERFTLNSQIQNGIGSHQNAELITDRLYILSSGGVDLNRLTMNENMLVSSTENPDGQGSQVPLNISGPIDNPSVTLNYSGLTQGLTTPEEKQKAISEKLRAQWRMLNR